MCFLYLHQGSSSTEEWILVSCPFLHFSSPTAFRVNKPTRIILEVQPGSGSWPSLWPFSTSRLHWPEFSLIRTAAALEETHQRHQFFMWWSFFSPPQNKSLKNKLLSGNKLCNAYAEEVSLENSLFSFNIHTFVLDCFAKWRIFNMDQIRKQTFGLKCGSTVKDWTKRCSIFQSFFQPGSESSIRERSDRAKLLQRTVTSCQLFCRSLSASDADFPATANVNILSF